MELVETRERFNFPADTVWDLTGDFGGLHKWLAGAKTCEVSGAGPRDTGGNAERTVTLMDGSITRESLESLDETNRCYSYAILEAKGLRKTLALLAGFKCYPCAITAVKLCGKPASPCLRGFRMKRSPK